MILFRPTVAADLDELEANIRDADAREQFALGITVRDALTLTWRETVIAKTAIVDGHVAACFGVGGCPLGGVGTPWLLTTRHCEKVPFTMVRCAIEETREWLTIFRRLENYVDATYREACRFLGTVGFTLEPPATLRHGSFREFWMERR